jgi:hypothetical protein
MNDKYLISMLDHTTRIAKEHFNKKKPFPNWLNKEIKAITLMTSNFDLGMTMFIEGAQDEVEDLKVKEEEWINSRTTRLSKGL